MSDLGDQSGAQLSAELGTLSGDARHVLASLAVFGRAPVSVPALAELSGIGDVRPAVQELEGRRLVRRQADDVVSLDPAVQARLKRLLATDDETDAVIAGLIHRAEDGRLEAVDVDAVDEGTRVASESGRWPQVLRLAQAAEPTLSAAQRVDPWTRIVERRLEAARALGDERAAAHARQELDRLAATGATTRVMTTQTEVAASAQPAARDGTNWPLVVLAGIALAALGIGLGYLIGDQTAETTTITESTPTETEVVTETGQATTVQQTTTESETVTVPETVVETQTVTVTVP